MKIAVVDDEIKWREAVKEHIARYLCDVAYEVECFASGEEFLEKDKDFSIVFMDVEMTGMDGFATLSEYRKSYDKSIFIILTTHIELSRKGYKVEAFRYIDKLCLEEIEEALESAMFRLRRYHTVEIPIVSMQPTKIRCYDILYFKVYGHEIMMHMSNDECMKCSGSLKEISEYLNERGFLLTDRSYLVNLDHVKKVEKSQVIMRNGDIVPMSRRKYDDVRKKYFDWKMQCANG